MRNLCKVIDYLTANVIPPEEERLLRRLKDLDGRHRYRPPEIHVNSWNELGQILTEELGNPKGVPWKERVRDVVSDVEKIPEDFK